jgi:hypothetical protein
MGHDQAQVALPEELPALKYDNDNDKVTAKNYAEARQHERRQQNERSGFKAAGFAYGRRNSILDLMHMRFGGPCLTDDAEVFAEVLIPFIVEFATLHRQRDGSRRDPHGEAHACLSHALPLWTAANPVQLSGMVAAAIAKRADAVAGHDPTGGRHIPWLPTMAELVATLRPTREEAQHLRGWSSIDPVSPEERREADRMRKRAARAANGATPRGESISARKPWEAIGISRASWYRRQREEQPETRETVSSAPYPSGNGMDVSVSPPKPAPAITLLSPIEAGFNGRNITLSPGILAGLKVRFPRLVPDLRVHLEDVEADMDRTPERCHLAVLYNRLKAKHRAVSRAATIAAKAGMPSLAAA